MQVFKRCIIVFVGLLLLASNPITVFAENKNSSVAIVLNPDSAVHFEIASTIVSEVSKKNETKFEYINRTDIPSLANIKNNFDYIISIGAESAKNILDNKYNIPVLFTLITKSTLENTLKKSKNSLYHGIHLSQPAYRKLKLSKLLLNYKGVVGLTLGPKSSSVIDEYKKQANKHGYKLVINKSSDYSVPVNAMRESINESQIYIATYDSEILNRHTAKWLLYMAYKMNKPVIGFSSAYTKAGAVASLFSTPKQIGRQCSEWLIDIKSNKNVKKIQSLKYFTVSINPRVQRTLKLPLISASELESKLLALEGGSK